MHIFFLFPTILLESIHIHINHFIDFSNSSDLISLQHQRNNYSRFMLEITIYEILTHELHQINLSDPIKFSHNLINTLINQINIHAKYLNHYEEYKKTTTKLVDLLYNIRFKKYFLNSILCNNSSKVPIKKNYVIYIIIKSIVSCIINEECFIYENINKYIDCLTCIHIINYINKHGKNKYKKNMHTLKLKKPFKINIDDIRVNINKVSDIDWTSVIIDKIGLSVGYNVYCVDYRLYILCLFNHFFSEKLFDICSFMKELINILDNLFDFCLMNTINKDENQKLQKIYIVNYHDNIYELYFQEINRSKIKTKYFLEISSKIAVLTKSFAEKCVNKKEIKFDQIKICKIKEKYFKKMKTFLRKTFYRILKK